MNEDIVNSDTLTYSIPIYEDGIQTEYNVEGVIGDEKYQTLIGILGNGKSLPLYTTITLKDKKL